ncbi:RNI-like protein [Choiromyces venosus 120613-1]|uniref:RNI-like protein n=1 Tax=Choiromyces venosus 120613-1 TaxID=1336337 RepID=A0A3N4JVK8_9PEZI|nr:RNI-like protein [Choiromyces venosus 120613-1]
MSNKVFILNSSDGKPFKFDTAADIEPHIASLKGNETVEEIRLSGHTFGIEACKALAEVLKTNTNLQVFNAADIFTGRLISEIPDALAALLTALLTLEYLHTVDLSDNAFGGRLADTLRDFYARAGPLRHLLLNNNGLGPTGGIIVANSIRDLATLKASNPAYPPLETIVCGRNRLENGSMEAWAEAYAAHKSLKTVKMVQNGIRQEGINTLLRSGLSKNLGLQTLDLQDNTFTVTGALALAAVVTNWSDLLELGVGDCLISARGGVLLGEALAQQKNKALKTIRLQYNEIDVKGVEAIKKAITPALPKLQRLELNGNKFSEEELVVEQMREIFEDRGFGELDSLSDMEEETDEEAEDEYDEKEDVVKQAEQAENAEVPQEEDKKVDALADLLGSSKIA